MKNLSFIICLAALNCAPHEQGKTPPSTETLPPEAERQAIQREFPGAMPFSRAIDTVLAHLARVGIKSGDILWGQSTCVDDITNTKNKIVHPEIKGPFTFGGLGGLPFTGATGIDAFAHHVPHDGTAVLFLGPHIGYRDGDGWGKIMRHGQEHSSTCCGALYAALTKLRNGEIIANNPSEDDYQQGTLEQLALHHRDSILSAPVPLVEFTRVVYKEAERKMLDYVSRVKERDFAYGVVIVGVIINTDYQYDDYLWIHHVTAKNIRKNEWIDVW